MFSIRANKVAPLRSPGAIYGAKARARSFGSSSSTQSAVWSPALALSRQTSTWISRSLSAVCGPGAPETGDGEHGQSAKSRERGAAAHGADRHSSPPWAAQRRRSRVIGRVERAKALGETRALLAHDAIGGTSVALARWRGKGFGPSVAAAQIAHASMSRTPQARQLIPSLGRRPNTAARAQVAAGPSRQRPGRGRPRGLAGPARPGPDRPPSGNRTRSPLGARARRPRLEGL